jgi:hypothetical protein
MSDKEMPETLSLYCKDFRFKGVMEFYRSIQEAFENGWVLWEDAPPRLAASMGQMPMVTFIKKEPEKELSQVVTNGDAIVEENFSGAVKLPENTMHTTEPNPSTKSPLEELSELTKVVPLREFADKLSIEIPKDMRLATAIKKYLKDQLEATQT